MSVVGEIRGIDIAELEAALAFFREAPRAVRALLAHADALQARLDAAEAERDQLRAIFKCDLLEDSEATRLAYERGRADLLREQEERWKAGGFPVPDHVTKRLQEFFRQGQFPMLNLNVAPLPLDTAVSPELLEDSASGIPGGLADDDRDN